MKFSDFLFQIFHLEQVFKNIKEFNYFGGKSHLFLQFVFPGDLLLLLLRLSQALLGHVDTSCRPQKGRLLLAPANADNQQDLDNEESESRSHPSKKGTLDRA